MGVKPAVSLQSIGCCSLEDELLLTAELMLDEVLETALLIAELLLDRTGTALLSLEATDDKGA